MNLKSPINTKLSTVNRIGLWERFAVVSTVGSMGA